MVGGGSGVGLIDSLVNREVMRWRAVGGRE